MLQQEPKAGSENLQVCKSALGWQQWFQCSCIPDCIRSEWIWSSLLLTLPDPPSLSQPNRQRGGFPAGLFSSRHSSPSVCISSETPWHSSQLPRPCVQTKTRPDTDGDLTDTSFPTPAGPTGFYCCGSQTEKLAPGSELHWCLRLLQHFQDRTCSASTLLLSLPPLLFTGMLSGLVSLTSTIGAQMFSLFATAEKEQKGSLFYWQQKRSHSPLFSWFTAFEKPENMQHFH